MAGDRVVVVKALRKFGIGNPAAHSRHRCGDVPRLLHRLATAHAASDSSSLKFKKTGRADGKKEISEALSDIQEAWHDLVEGERDAEDQERL